MGEGGGGRDNRKRKGPEREIVDVGGDIRKVKVRKRVKLKSGSWEEKGRASFLLCWGSAAERRNYNWEKLKGDRRYRGNGFILMYNIWTSFEIKGFHEETRQHVTLCVLLVLFYEPDCNIQPEPDMKPEVNICIIKANKFPSKLPEPGK